MPSREAAFCSKPRRSSESERIRRSHLSEQPVYGQVDRIRKHWPVGSRTGAAPVILPEFKLWQHPRMSCYKRGVENRSVPTAFCNGLDPGIAAISVPSISLKTKGDFGLKELFQNLYLLTHKPPKYSP